MTKPWPTLDYLAARTAQQINQVIGQEVKREKKVEPKEVDIFVTKALGVLQTQGVYAMALFVLSRSGSKSQAGEMSSEERIACEVIAQLWPLRDPVGALKKAIDASGTTDEITYNQVNAEKNDLLQAFADLTGDLDTLLLVRDLYEQTLIYARYGAKAAGTEEGTGTTDGREATP